MKIGKKRQEKLLLLASNHLNAVADDFFSYGYWDGLIECDNLLSVEELEWLEENYVAAVTLEAKEA